MNNRSGVSGVHAAVRTPPKLHPQMQIQYKHKYRDARAQKHKYRSTRENTNTKNKQRDARTKVEACARTYKYNNKTPLHIKIHPKRAKSKYARKYKPRWTFGPNTRCFFFLRTDLFMQVQQGRNYEA